MHTLINRYPARQRAQLIATGISLTRGTALVLHEVDLVITPSSRVAIIGENGRGKSSLLHVLTGALTPDSGTVQLIGTVGIAEQEMDAEENRTVGQVVAEAIAAPLTALAALDAADVPVGKIYTAADIATDPQYHARGMVLPSTDREGRPLKVPGIVPKLSDTPGALRHPAPRLGEHDAEVIPATGWPRPRSAQAE